MDHSTSLNFNKLSHDYISKLKDAFQMIDVDGDGTITKNDLRNVLHSVGKPCSDEDLDNMLEKGNVKEVEANGERAINFPEFLSLMSDITGEFPEENELIDCFKNLNDNQKGLSLPLNQLIKNLEDAGFKDPEREFAKIFKHFSTTHKATSTEMFKADNFLNTISDT